MAAVGDDGGDVVVYRNLVVGVVLVYVVVRQW